MAYSLNGTEKAFEQDGKLLTLQPQSYTKSRKNFFVLQFQLLGTKWNFCTGTIIDVNRCPSDLPDASPVFKSKVGLGSLC